MDGEQRIAVVQRGGVLRAGNASDPGAVREIGAGYWPTWSAGGAALAWSTGAPVSAVHSSTGEPGSAPSDVFVVPAGSLPFIAPRVPHYVLWSPAGHQLAVVAQSPVGLALTIASRDGVHPQHVTTAAPIFPSWSPDGRSLAVHAAADLFLLDMESGQRTPLSSRSTGFRTAAWSPDGAQVAFAVATETGLAITVSDAHGQNRFEVARMPGGVAFAFRPGTLELCIAVARRPETGLFDELWSARLDGEDRNPIRIARGPFAACHWAPDGTKAALIMPYHSADGRFFVRVIDDAGTVVATSEAFVPSEEFRLHSQFFDQYGLSHPIWSADSDCLVIAGRLVHDGVSAAFGDPEGPRIFSWTARRGAPLDSLIVGEFAAFAPPALPAL